MASKKEHKRRMKAKERVEKEEHTPPVSLRPTPELNRLDLLSIVDAPKPGGAAGENDEESDAAAALREMEERERSAGRKFARPKRRSRCAAQVRREAESAELRRAEQATRAADEADRQARAEERDVCVREANTCDNVWREANEAERRREERERIRHEERKQLAAEAADRERREAEERARQLRQAEAAEKARREAEEAERRRRELEDRAKREEEARAAQARAAEQARREAEERERERLRAAEQEREAAERARRQNEEMERQAREAAEAELCRQQAEEEEKQRLEQERAAVSQAARDAEERARAVREAEERDRLAREAEDERRRAEEAEKARRASEEEEQRRQEQAAAQRAKEMAAETERIRLMAEQVEKARREALEAERLYREELAARQNRDEPGSERAQQMAEAAERARAMSEKVEQARLEAEQRERDALTSETAPEESAPELDIDAMVAEAMGESAPEPAVETSAAPKLEVDNPYWEKSPEIFEMLSGAPHSQAGDPYGTDNNRDQAMPVSMHSDHEQLPRSEFPHGNKTGTEELTRSSTQPVPAEKRMYIVMITPEVAPCAKVGGLGDVILGLGRELMKRGHGVEVICPMYAGMRYDQIYDLHEEYGELWSPHYNEWRAEKVFQGKVEGGLQVNFITGGNYTERENIYGYDDDLQRFAYFSRQALEFMFKTNRRPEIIHCHDWATGLVPAILWDVYEKLGWNNTRAVYTIHNNECQGLCGFPDKLLGLVGLDFRKYMTPDKMQDDSHRNCINMMKSGIVFSNFVTTVSPTYAGELKSAAGGRGLQTTIAKNSAKVGGVLNGIDYDSWNPETDPKLASRFTVGEDFFKKYDNKKALREWLGLYDAWKPIVSVVTRLTHQKGLDLIKAAIFMTMEMDGQFVLLGSAPDPKVNDSFLRLQYDLRDNHDCSLYIGYHEDLSRIIYSGSDMFLIPSLYEPCGLTQMISLRYGTVPIVRETGGLVDTVFDLDNSGRGLNNANGFTFRDANTASLRYGLERGIRLWYDNPEAFNRLARNGMRYDYSWRNPAEHYENIYNYVKA